MEGGKEIVDTVSVLDKNLLYIFLLCITAMFVFVASWLKKQYNKDREVQEGHNDKQEEINNGVQHSLQELVLLNQKVDARMQMLEYRVQKVEEQSQDVRNDLTAVIMTGEVYNQFEHFKKLDDDKKNNRKNSA